MKLGLYIHIPFCNIKCDYCLFYSLPLNGLNDNTAVIGKYLSALLREIDLRQDELKNYEVDTVYFGGGTPSLLHPGDLERILSHLYKKFNFSGTTGEITVECNPGNYSGELINEFRMLGINRVVLGVQTLNKNLFGLIGRLGRICDIQMLKDFAGMPDIIHCVDIIFGIPGQTWDMLYQDLEKIADFEFEHISAYSLSIDKGTPLYKKRDQLPDTDELYRSNFENTIEYLVGKGYLHYEVSNYAFPGFESKHNMKYWKFLPYAGFGPGAHSFYNNERYYNTANVDEYILNNGDIRQRDVRGGNSTQVEYILSGMRLSEGISLREMEKKTGGKIPDEMMGIIKRMNEYGLLTINDIKDDLIIKFTREGFFRMDSLIYELTEIFL